jgi:hypothetical protein
MRVPGLDDARFVGGTKPRKWHASCEQGARYIGFCHASRSQSGSCRRHCEADHASAHCAADPSRPFPGRQGQDRARASSRSIRRLAFRARMGRAAVASAGRTHFEADQSRSRDGTAPQFVTVLPLRRGRFQRLQIADPHQSCGEKDRGTRLGGPSNAARTLMSDKKRLRTVERFIRALGRQSKAGTVLSLVVRYR